MINSLCVIIKQPGGLERSTLGLREAAAADRYALEIKILFIDDGVYNLLNRQGYNAALIQNLLQADVEIFCIEESLRERGLTHDSLPRNINIIPEKTVADLISDCDAVTLC